MNPWKWLEKIQKCYTNQNDKPHWLTKIIPQILESKKKNHILKFYFDSIT